jgi:hypothetical protein
MIFPFRNVLRIRNSSHTVLIHYHVFKNAGSSVDRLLRECLGSRWTTFEGADATDVQSAGNLGDFLARRPALLAVSSHLARPPLPSPRCVPIVLLRHPIDRARSVYQFVRRDSSQPHHDAAIGSFADFVTWVLDNPRAGVPIANYQVFHLSDASFRADNACLASTPQDLAQVQAMIASWPAFGIVREFAASCRLFQVRYAPLCPDLRLRDVRENSSPDWAPSEAEALDAARDELGEAVFARLQNANALDLALYAFARRRFGAMLEQAARETDHGPGTPWRRPTLADATA